MIDIHSDGESLPDIKKQVTRLNLTDAVYFLGARKDVNELINSIDIFVMPSLYEGLGIVYLEAQAIGVPCYGSEEGVPQAVNVSNLMHYLSLKQSPEEWATEILKNYDINNRYNVHSELREAGYDITVEAKKLEYFFINGETE